MSTVKFESVLPHFFDRFQKLILQKFKSSE